MADGRLEIIPRRRAAKLESSWFMRCLFIGWFSATADQHYIHNRCHRKLEFLEKGAGVE